MGHVGRRWPLWVQLGPTGDRPYLAVALVQSSLETSCSGCGPGRAAGQWVWGGSDGFARWLLGCFPLGTGHKAAVQSWGPALHPSTPSTVLAGQTPVPRRPPWTPTLFSVLCGPGAVRWARAGAVVEVGVGARWVGVFREMLEQLRLAWLPAGARWQ